MSFGTVGDPRRFDTIEEMLKTHWAESSWYHKLKVKLYRRPRNRVVWRYWAIKNKVRSLWQFHRRGWTEEQAANFSSMTMLAVGRQLMHLSKFGHGWPGEETGYTETEWAAALNNHGKALIHFAKSDEIQLKPGGYEEYKAEYDRRHEAAKRALTWVGENLPSIWD